MVPSCALLSKHEQRAVEPSFLLHPVTRCWCLAGTALPATANLLLLGAAREAAEVVAAVMTMSGYRVLRKASRVSRLDGAPAPRRCRSGSRLVPAGARWGGGETSPPTPPTPRRRYLHHRRLARHRGCSVKRTSARERSVSSPSLRQAIWCYTDTTCFHRKRGVSGRPTSKNGCTQVLFEESPPRALDRKILKSRLT